MKIALLTQHFAPDFEGGTEAVVRAQARELLARGHDVFVISGTDQAHAGEDVWAAEADGVRVFFLPRQDGEYMDLALERPRVQSLITELVGESDLIHVHHWATLTGSLVRHFSRSRPVVVTLHDYFLTCPRYFRLPPKHIERCPERGDIDPCVLCVKDEVPAVLPVHIAKGFVLRNAANQAELNAAAAVIVPSRAHAEGLRRFIDIDEAKLFCVPHGIDRALTRLEVPEWNGEGRLRMLFLGHRSEVKGVHDVAAAMAALPPKQRGRVELVLLGDEMADGFDRLLVQTAGEIKLSFVGNYTTESVADRIREIGVPHLAVFPSRAFESYGLVPDELLACGLPVWVSDRGAPKERIGAAGRVLPAADSKAWSRALLEVLETPGRLAQERAAVPAHVRTAKDAVLELERIYDGLSKGRRSHPAH